jgi:ABC-2 type transport system permease protein
MCKATEAVIKRELAAYFQTPVAYVFILVFLLSNGAFTFYLSGYFERGLADLEPFFQWHPWIYLIFIPAVSMRLWAEERRSGTIELIMTLPISPWKLVLGKFLAAWAFVVIALLCTLPMWWTVNYLGNPDNGVIATAYLGSALMAGAYLAIGSAMSAATSNQVIAFILGAAVSLIFTMAGFSVVVTFVEGWLPQSLVNALTSLSFLSNYADIQRGVLEAKSLIYFSSMMVFWLFVTLLLLEARRGR